MNEWGDYCPLEIAYGWGVPDWRDEAAYGDTSVWSRHRWRWEFIRRQKDYREDYSRLALRSYVEQCEDAASMRERGVPWPRIRAPIEPGYTAHAENPWKYGYLRLPNPGISEQTNEVLSPLPGYDHAPRFVEGHGTRWEQGGEPNAAMSLGEGTIGACFDLDKPIRPQILAAERALKIWQVERRGKKAQRRPKRADRLLSLRTLDALADGLSYAEVHDALLRHKGSTEERRQSARDSIKVARQMWSKV